MGEVVKEGVRERERERMIDWEWKWVEILSGELIKKKEWEKKFNIDNDTNL